MKLFNCEQIRAIEKYTIDNEPVQPIELMERASGRFFEWFIRHFDRTCRVFVFIGPGNNGADGLAVSRMLAECDFKTEVFFINTSENRSDLWITNFNRIKQYPVVQFNEIYTVEQFPVISSGDIIIDALFGSGLNRPIDGLKAEVVKKLNSSGNRIVSVDMPSGLFGENNRGNNTENIIRANYTVTFQVPRLSFLFPENNLYTGNWIVAPIGLHPVALTEVGSPYFLLESKDILPLLKARNKFDHKGKFGHGLLVAGSAGKTGAAVLGARAALRTGIGLITCHIPNAGTQVLQTSVPEAIVQSDEAGSIISHIGNIEKFSAIAVGPGIGTDKKTKAALAEMLSQSELPVVADADAINIFASEPELLKLLKGWSILTPHLKEFERLTGYSADSYERLQKQISFSIQYKCIVILKGAHSSVSMPDGRVFFNNTGNPGMATAGSGDVLTGILLSLISQGYSSENAALTGVWLHGLAGDLAAAKSGYESLIASDIIDNIGNAFAVIRGQYKNNTE